MLSRQFDYNNTKIKSATVQNIKRFEKPHRQGVFKPKNKITINLPMIPNAFGDLKNSFLKFDIHSAGESKFDNSAYCLFEKIVVSSKNIILDELNNVGSYYNLALSLNNISTNGYNNVIGQNNDRHLPNQGQGVSTNVNNPTQITLPFIHGLWSCDRYLPLFSKSGVKIEFYLNDENNSLLATNSANATFEIRNLEFVYPMMTLPEETFNSLNSSIDNYFIDVNSVFHHQVSVEQNSKQEYHIIPCRYSSVNSLMLMMPNTTDATTPNRIKYSARNASNLTEIQLKHKGVNYPQNPLKRVRGDDTNVATTNAKNSSEMYLTSLSTYSSVNSYNFRKEGDAFVLSIASAQTTDGDGSKVISTYERENCNVPNFTAVNNHASANNTEFGSFFVAIPLTSYLSPELNEASYSGLNTIGQDVYVNLQFGDTGVPVNSLFEYYTNYNSVIVLDKNTLEFSLIN